MEGGRAGGSTSSGCVSKTCSHNVRFSVPLAGSSSCAAGRHVGASLGDSGRRKREDHGVRATGIDGLGRPRLLQRRGEKARVLPRDGPGRRRLLLGDAPRAEVGDEERPVPDRLQRRRGAVLADAPGDGPGEGLREGAAFRGRDALRAKPRHRGDRRECAADAGRVRVHRRRELDQRTRRAEAERGLPDRRHPGGPLGGRGDRGGDGGGHPARGSWPAFFGQPSAAPPGLPVERTRGAHPLRRIGRPRVAPSRPRRASVGWVGERTSCG